jgi:hypothetical protein
MVTFVNPAPGGGASGALTFAIDAPDAGPPGDGGTTDGGTCSPSSCTAVAPSTAACVDGRCLVTLAAGLPEPYGIALDSTNVYWAGFGASGPIAKIPKNGGASTTLANTSTAGATSVAIDAVNVYWASTGLQKVRIDGDGGAVTVDQNAAYTPSKIALNSGAIYFTAITHPGNGGQLLQVGVDGGASVALASDPTKTFINIATDATSVYWVTQVPSTGIGDVLKVALDGGAPVTLASGQDHPWGIAVDAVNVYWTGNGVMKAPLSGGPPVALDSTPGGSGIAVDANYVYWASPVGTGTVMKVPINGGPSTVLASNQANPTYVAIDATSVYWTNQGFLSNDGSVMKTDK